MGILQFESVNCKDCCKCIGVCPVKAIEVKNHRAMIVERDCVLCGNCTVVCPQHTKHGTDFSREVRELIRSGKRVIASVAPSYAAYFNGCGFESLKSALKALGFYDARETAEGAHIVKTEYEKLIAGGITRPVISSCCTTLNLYIQKHCPEAIDMLAPVLTPMQAHARLIHSEDPGAMIVFVGPCISKKEECTYSASELEYAITFDELGDWFKEAGVSVMPQEESAPKLSRFFPVSGGVLKTMAHQSGINYVAVDGPEACMAAVRDALSGKLNGCFIEMSFCQGSCIGGPVFRNADHSAAAGYVNISRDAMGDEDFETEAAGSLQTSFKDCRTYYSEPTEKQIAAVFKKMGKEGPEDELNCGMCGYASCRDKAIAVLMGRAEISMCMPYMKKRAESFSDKILSITPDAILAVDMDLRIVQINKAACDMFSVQPSDVMGGGVSALLDEFDFVDLISSGESAKDKFTYLAEYNLYLKQSLYFDASSGIVICIMKNITREKQRQNAVKQHKTQVAGMADDIVEKQLRIVHEIASLLGESAAETKVAISKLKEAVMMENEEQ